MLKFKNMDDKLKKIIEHLEAEIVRLADKRTSEIEENTSTYFLYVGREGELGNVIDYIESQYK